VAVLFVGLGTDVRLGVVEEDDIVNDVTSDDTTRSMDDGDASGDTVSYYHPSFHSTSNINHQNIIPVLTAQTMINPSPMCKQGWTGPIPSIPSSSRVAQPTPPGSYTPHVEDQGFEERFKYLICSSGVLEKDYVPGLSGGLADDEVVGTTTDVDTLHTEGVDVDGAGEVRVGQKDVSGTFGFGDVWIHARERWDLVLAGLAFVMGVILAVGLKRVAIYGVLFGCLLVGGRIYSYRRSITSVSSPIRYSCRY
jgi:hypothetical protein